VTHGDNGKVVVDLNIETWAPEPISMLHVPPGHHTKGSGTAGISVHGGPLNLETEMDVVRPKGDHLRWIVKAGFDSCRMYV
jgi:hypothetical protein